jgi:thiol:disulfide interchange protein DsbD
MKKIILCLVFIISALMADEFLEPKDAFKSSFLQQNDKIIYKLNLGKDIYIYADKLKFKDGANEIKSIKLPEPVKHDEFIVYDKNLTVEIDAKLVKSELIVELQGCSSAGLCYAPLEEKYKLASPSKQTAQDEKNIQKLNETDAIASTMASGSLLLVLITFFGFGLLLSLTPCVFPMIPILSSIIVKQSQAKQLSAFQGFVLSLVYVLSMAFAYTIAGVIAGVFGANLQAALQHPAVLVAFSAIFIALAMSMFGYYEIGLPASLQSKLSRVSDNQKGGLIGTAIMGFLSALIVGPCVAPPLAGALVYIGQTGDAFLGGAALFVMSIGMGLPLLAIGLGAGKFMPKAGMWMQTITRVFGVIMLGVAIWMLERILPPFASLILWSILFISSAFFVGTFEPSKEHSKSVFKLVKAFGFIMLILGSIIFTGAIAGAKSIFNPLEPFIQQKGETNSAELKFEKVSDLRALQEKIKNSDKPVLLDFYADWCTSCKEYDEITFKDPSVIKALEGFTKLRIDVTKNSLSDKEMIEHFGLFGPPAIIFWNSNKEELKDMRLVGYKNPSEFLAHIDLIKAKK